MACGDMMRGAKFKSCSSQKCVVLQLTGKGEQSFGHEISSNRWKNIQLAVIIQSTLKVLLLMGYIFQDSSRSAGSRVLVTAADAQLHESNRAKLLSIMHTNESYLPLGQHHKIARWAREDGQDRLLEENRLQNNVDRRSKNLKKLLSTPRLILSSFVPHTKQSVIKRPNNLMSVKLKRIHDKLHNTKTDPQVTSVEPLISGKPTQTFTVHPVQVLGKPGIFAFGHPQIPIRPILLPKQVSTIGHPIGHHENSQIVLVHKVFPRQRPLEAPRPSQFEPGPSHSAKELDSQEEKEELEAEEEDDDPERGLEQMDQLIRHEFEVRMNHNDKLLGDADGRRIVMTSLSDGNDSANGMRMPPLGVEQLDKQPTTESSIVEQQEAPTTIESIRDWPPVDELTEFEANRALPTTTAQSLIPDDSTDPWRPTDYPPADRVVPQGLPPSERKSKQISDSANGSNQIRLFDLGSEKARFRPVLAGGDYYQFATLGNRFRDSQPAKSVEQKSRGAKQQPFVPSALETIVQLKLNHSTNQNSANELITNDDKSLLLSSPDYAASSSNFKRVNGNMNNDNQQQHQVPKPTYLVPTLQNNGRFTGPAKPIHLQESSNRHQSFASPPIEPQTSRQLQVELALNQTRNNANSLYQPNQRRQNRPAFPATDGQLGSRLSQAMPFSLQIDTDRKHSHQIHPGELLISSMTALSSDAHLQQKDTGSQVAESGRQRQNDELDDTLRRLRETQARIKVLQAELNATDPGALVMTSAASSVGNITNRESGAMDATDGNNNGNDESDAHRTTSMVTNVGQPADWFRLWIPTNGTSAPVIGTQRAMSLPLGMYHSGPMSAPARLMASAFGRAAHVALASTSTQASHPLPANYHSQGDQPVSQPTSAPILLTSTMTVREEPQLMVDGDTDHRAISSSSSLAFSPTSTSTTGKPGRGFKETIRLVAGPKSTAQTATEETISPYQLKLSQANQGGDSQPARTTVQPFNMNADDNGISSKDTMKLTDGTRFHPPTTSSKARESPDNGNQNLLLPEGVLSDTNQNIEQHLLAKQREDKWPKSGRQFQSADPLAVGAAAPSLSSPRQPQSQLGQRQQLQQPEAPLPPQLAGKPARKSTSRSYLSTPAPIKANESKDAPQRKEAIGFGKGFDLDKVNSVNLFNDRHPSDGQMNISDKRNEDNQHGGASIMSQMFDHLFDAIATRVDGTNRQADSLDQNALPIEPNNSTKSSKTKPTMSKLTTERVLQILILLSCSAALICVLVVFLTVRHQARTSCKRTVRIPASGLSEPQSSLLSPLDWCKFSPQNSESTRNQHDRLILDGTMRNISLHARHQSSSSKEQTQGDSQLSKRANLPHPTFNRSCCHCVTCSESWLFRDVGRDKQANRAHPSDVCSSGFYHPAPRGKLPFGAASSVNKFLLHQQTLEGDLESVSFAGKQEISGGPPSGRAPVGGTRLRMMSAINERLSQSSSPGAMPANEDLAQDDDWRCTCGKWMDHDQEEPNDDEAGHSGGNNSMNDDRSLEESCTQSPGGCVCCKDNLDTTNNCHQRLKLVPLRPANSRELMVCNGDNSAAGYEDDDSHCNATQIEGTNKGCHCDNNANSSPQSMKTKQPCKGAELAAGSTESSKSEPVLADERYTGGSSRKIDPINVASKQQAVNSSAKNTANCESNCRGARGDGCHHRSDLGGTRQTAAKTPIGYCRGLTDADDTTSAKEPILSSVGSTTRQNCDQQVLRPMLNNESNQGLK